MKLEKLEQLEQQILVDGIIPEFREADVRGTFEVQVATVKEAIEADYSKALLPKATANTDALKLELRSKLEKQFKAELSQSGPASGAAFLTDLIKELQETRREVEAEKEALEGQIQQKQKTLLKDLQAHTKGFRKRARFEKWLPGNVGEINALTKKKIAKARIPALLALLGDLLDYAEALRMRLGTLVGCIVAAASRLTTQKEQEEHRVTQQGVFAEVLGGSQDVAFAFEKLSLNFKAFLPGWFDRTPSEVTPEDREAVIERICRDVIAAFPKSTDEALEAYSYIDKHLEEVQQKVLAAYMTFAVPFVNLGSEPESELQTLIHTGHRSSAPISEKLQEQVPVTESLGLDPNEIVVTRVRIGLGIQEIGGVKDWQEQADALQDRFPLYAVNPNLLDELSLNLDLDETSTLDEVEELEQAKSSLEVQDLKAVSPRGSS